ncbi:MAG: phenylpyruvate tautomerase MIF-related protein [Lachnospiraceae bacterium]|nr:phenylpyruvate tautomerase MIF-related protein [Lachnospiraceae bacterium]
MPFINSKISTDITPEQETTVKELLGQAISVIPGKSESWLMVGFEPNYKLYFKGDNSEPTAFVEVSVFGTENRQAFNMLTAKICEIFKQVLNIPQERVYVKYEATGNWGWNGGNF